MKRNLKRGETLQRAENVSSIQKPQGAQFEVRADPVKKGGRHAKESGEKRGGGTAVSKANPPLTVQ